MKANQDIRDYMADHGVTQRDLAAEVGVSQWSISNKLKDELSQKVKEMYLNMIDSIAAARIENDETPADEPDPIVDEDPDEESGEEPTPTNDISVSTKFQIGDRVKIPSKTLCVGVIVDIWYSLVQNKTMYAVENEDGGNRGLYAENQLEPAPLPIEYTFNATVENNVAVVCMIAKQGDKTWVHARGHAHILHDGAVGMAQAVSYASKRMFESLDRKQPNQIYFKGDEDKQ